MPPTRLRVDNTRHRTETLPTSPLATIVLLALSGHLIYRQTSRRQVTGASNITSARHGTEPVPRAGAELDGARHDRQHHDEGAAVVGHHAGGLGHRCGGVAEDAEHVTRR